MTYQELEAKNLALKRAAEISKKENLEVENKRLKIELENLEMKNKVASLEQQLQQLYKLIQGFKSEKFVPQANALAQLELFANQQSPAPLLQKEEISYTRNH